MIKPEIQAMIDQQIAQTKTNHEAEISQLKADHQTQVNTLQAQFEADKARIEQEAQEAVLTAFKSGLQGL